MASEQQEQRQAEPEDVPYSENEFVQTTQASMSMPLEMLRYGQTPNGCHYVLTHFEVPDVGGVRDDDWQIDVAFVRAEGAVEQPLLTVSLAELRRMADVEGQAASLAVTMECAGNGRALMKPRRPSIAWRYGGVSTAKWRGVLLSVLLDKAGLFTLDGTTSDELLADFEIRFFGEDKGVEAPAIAPPGSLPAVAASLFPECKQLVSHYSFGVPLRRVFDRSQQALLAFEMNDEPVPLRHGAPVRAILPGCFGMASVKHLRRVVVQPLTLQNHYWQNIAYHLFPTTPSLKPQTQTPKQQDNDKPDPNLVKAQSGNPFLDLLDRTPPVLDIVVKSAFVPVGHPLDLHAETRILAVSKLPATVAVSGKAWSGCHAIKLVEWRSNADQPWTQASTLVSIDRDVCGSSTEFAWSSWSDSWTIHAPGEYNLQVRATNAVGEQQPMTATWNYGGFANNSVQTMKVRVKLVG